jgi:hypothetical protein
MLMFVNTTWTESTFIATVMCYACFYGGFGQMVAGVFEVSHQLPPLRQTPQQQQQRSSAASANEAARVLLAWCDTHASLHEPATIDRHIEQPCARLALYAALWGLS